jgi:hypothetical protein
MSQPLITSGLFQGLPRSHRPASDLPTIPGCIFSASPAACVSIESHGNDQNRAVPALEGTVAAMRKGVSHECNTRM